jgi:hypothetical protein
LLSALLSQNPVIHAEGNSALCQLMWDMQQSCLNNAKEQLNASGRMSVMDDILSELPKIYYKNINSKEKIVVDKCRSWTISANVELLKKYISYDFKVIVLERSIKDIIKSFAKLYKLNNVKNIDENIKRLLTPNSEPIMRSISGINWAKKNNKKNNFLFINYEELIKDPATVINKIYDFCGWEHYKHDFNNVVVKYPEDDNVYHLRGQHKIRKNVEKKENDYVLPKDIEEQCLKIDRLMGWGDTPQNPQLHK